MWVYYVILVCCHPFVTLTLSLQLLLNPLGDLDETCLGTKKDHIVYICAYCKGSPVQFFFKESKPLDLHMAFSSLELKAQVSFSDRPSSVCLCVCPPICLYKLLHFRLLLQNHWANFNQTWHKSSLRGGDSKLYKRKGTALPKGR
jgi:hypothetical protein